MLKRNFIIGAFVYVYGFIHGIFHILYIFVCMNLCCMVMIPFVSPQVEIPGARGKPASLVEKDDGVDKVAITFHFMP